jgi:hypothetical protein
MLTVLILAASLLGNIGTKSAHAHSFTAKQVKVFKKNYQKSESVVRWFNNRGRWALYTRHNRCITVKPKSHTIICWNARQALRKHALRMKRLKPIIAPPLVPDGYPPHYKDWKCIMYYEAWHHGKWRANTGNGFYGGLQMNMDFQRAYGASLLRTKGTADNWTPREQMWVAEKGLRARGGFNPWPNTGRYCGLPMHF